MLHPTMNEKLTNLENNKKELTVYIEEAKLQETINSICIDDLRKYLLKDMDIETKSPKEKQKIIQTYINKVIVYENTIDINYIVDMSGGGGGCRTHVRRHFHKSFSERS